MREQTIWLSPRVTAFTAVCQECIDESREGWSFGARVEGTLAMEKRHGSATCARGHTIFVERGPAVAAAG